MICARSGATPTGTPVTGQVPEFNSLFERFKEIRTFPEGASYYLTFSRTLSEDILTHVPKECFYKNLDIIFIVL